MMMNRKEKIQAIFTAILLIVFTGVFLVFGVLAVRKNLLCPQNDCYEDRELMARIYANYCSQSILRYFEKYKSVPQKSCSSFQNEFFVKYNPVYINKTEIFFKSEQVFRIRITDKKNDSYLYKRNFSETSFEPQ
jgi:hypothetical protein